MKERGNIANVLLLVIIFATQWFFSDNEILQLPKSDKKVLYVNDISEIPRAKIMKNSIAAVVYMTCYEKEPMDENRFIIPAVHIQCQNRTYDEECHEAVPMLRFIYKYYDSLKGKLFFVHGHEYSWHYKSSIYTVVNDRVRSNDFNKTWFGALYNACWHHRPPWRSDPGMKKLFYEIYHGTSMMKYYDLSHASFPCCASFVVDVECFKSRPRHEYKIFIERLMNYSYFHKNPSFLCGRLLEYTWPMLLGDITSVPHPPVP